MCGGGGVTGGGGGGGAGGLNLNKYGMQRAVITSRLIRINTNILI